MTVSLSKITAALLFTLIVLSWTRLAYSLDFVVHPNNESRSLTAILATGEIEPGDAEKLKALINSVPRRKNTAVYLASGGGDLNEGIRLGNYFRSSRIKTVVEGNSICASACALAFLGGTDNEGNPWRSSSTNSRLGFHAFRGRAGQPLSSNEIQMLVSVILGYGQSVNAPIELLIANFATPSEEMYWVPNQRICDLGIKLWSVETNRFVCND